MRPLVLLVVSGVAWAQTPKLELAIAPVAVQLNGKYTQHVGTFGSVTLQLREGIGLQVLGGGNWINGESAFNGELVEKFRVEAQAASALLWTWGVFGGVEVEPFLAKFTLLNGPLVHFGVVLGGGVGAGGTRHQLKPQTATPASYGDTGPRFMGTFAAGFRLALGRHFTLRLDVRDVAYSARIDKVNGCSLPALTDLIERPGVQESAECRGFPTQVDASLARALVRTPGSAVLHNVGLYVGAGFVF